jgi:hypothetical protein
MLDGPSSENFIRLLVLENFLQSPDLPPLLQERVKNMGQHPGTIDKQWG